MNTDLAEHTAVMLTRQSARRGICPAHAMEREVRRTRRRLFQRVRRRG